MVMFGVVTANADATVIWVDCNSTGPVSPYASKAEAAKTITDALAVATGDGPYEIRVCKGAYTDTGMTLAAAIAVVGDTGDPADVVITDATTGQRAFTMSHADARIEALKITGTGRYGTPDTGNTNGGGHVRMTSGTVRNCVIERGQCCLNNDMSAHGGNVAITGGVVEDCLIQDGQVGRKGRGGNVYMTGGTVRRCRILNGVGHSLAGTGGYEAVCGGVYATGGLIDSCLLVGNKITRFGYCGGLYLGGTTTALNCSVFGSTVDGTVKASTSRLNYGFGAHIASADAKAVNTVVYDNGGDEQKEYGTANLGNYHNCASSVANASDANWKTITANDFTAYTQGDYTLPLTSKMVDAGTLDPACYPAEASTTDLAGNARVSTTLIDIGCYETDKSKASCSGSLSTYAVLEGSNVVCAAEATGVGDTPVFKWNFGNGTTVETTEARYTYAYPTSGLFTVSVSASGDNGTTWTAPTVLTTKIVVAPETMYVDSANESPNFPFKTKGDAATTITAALNAMTNNISEDVACVPGVEIRIVAGTATTESGMVLAVPISIRGESGDPADVVITHKGTANRAFTVAHADALMEGLTVSGSGSQAVDGGHVHISAGTVRNCIVENGLGPNSGSAGLFGCNVCVTGGVLEDSTIRGGQARRKTWGGNVALTGGTVRRCRILNGVASSQADLSSLGFVSMGGGVYMTGGVLENCLLSGNNVGRFSYTGGLYVDGGTVLNCTVIKGTVTSDVQSGTFGNYGVGIHVANANAMVINTVVYDNGGTAQKEFGTTNLGCYDFCASSVANASAAHWTAMTAADFVDYDGWASSQNVEGLRANGRTKAGKTTHLINAGTTWEAYLASGATSTTDLLGGARLNSRRLDIGCLEGVKAGGLIFLVQ